MNKYEQIVNTLVEGKNHHIWEYISPRQVPNVLKRYGIPDKVYKTEMAENLCLYLYTVLENKYNEDFDHCYMKEYIYCSIFIDGNEVDTFGFDNVSSVELYRLLNMVQEKVFDYKNRLKEILTC